MEKNFGCYVTNQRDKIARTGHRFLHSNWVGQNSSGQTAILTNLFYKEHQTKISMHNTSVQTPCAKLAASGATGNEQPNSASWEYHNYKVNFLTMTYLLQVQENSLL
jgi:hypothetical protein